MKCAPPSVSASAFDPQQPQQRLSKHLRTRSIRPFVARRRGALARTVRGAPSSHRARLLSELRKGHSARRRLPSAPAQGADRPYTLPKQQRADKQSLVGSMSRSTYSRAPPSSSRSGHSGWCLSDQVSTNRLPFGTSRDRAPYIVFKSRPHAPRRARASPRMGCTLHAGTDFLCPARVETHRPQMRRARLAPRTRAS